jgi:hypothetical protein
LIKPDKFIGKVYCNNIYTPNCVLPQLVFTNGENQLDLRQSVFLTGDISQQDGKVDSYDLSKILSDIGKTSNNYLESDLNGDLIVNALDYSLALYSISENPVDDSFITVQISPTPVVQISSFQPTNTPALSPSSLITVVPTIIISFTPTPSIYLPTVTNTITPTFSLPVASPTYAVIPSSTIVPTVSAVPTGIPTSTLIPTAVFTVTPVPTATTVPTSTPVPTSTTVPSPTPTIPQKGKCNTSISGKVYINAPIIGIQCRILNNETGYYCVKSETDCNETKGKEYVLNKIKQTTSSCSNGIASVNEQKTQINCQTQFIPGECSPEPSTGCEDTRQKC